MSDNNKSSPEWTNIVNDAKKLFGSLTVGVKKVIEHYKSSAEKKPADDASPQSPSRPVAPPPPVAPAPEQPKEEVKPAVTEDDKINPTPTATPPADSDSEKKK